MTIFWDYLNKGFKHLREAQESPEKSSKSRRMTVEYSKRIYRTPSACLKAAIELQLFLSCDCRKEKEAEEDLKNEKRDINFQDGVVNLSKTPVTPIIS